MSIAAWRSAWQTLWQSVWLASAGNVLDFAALTPAALASRFGWVRTGAGTLIPIGGPPPIAGPQDGATYLMRAPDYSYDVAGLLLEGQRTQLLGKPEDPADAYWFKESSSVSGKVITESAFGGNHRLESGGMSVAAGDNHTLSVDAVATSGRWLLASFGGASSYVWAVVNTGTGVVTASGAAGSASIVSAAGYEYAPGKYGVRIVGAPGVSLAYVEVGLTNTATPTVGAYGLHSYTGNGSSNLTWERVQFEAGAYPTSHIPNSGTGTVLRAADAAEIGPGAEFDSLFPAAQGTIVVEWCDLGATEGDMLALHSNGTTNELISLYYSGSSILTLCRAGSANQLAATLGTRIPNAVNKAAISWGPAGLSVVLNGGTVQANASATIPAPTHASWAGALASGSQAAWKPTKRTVLSTQTTGAALQALTV